MWPPAKEGYTQMGEKEKSSLLVGKQILFGLLGRNQPTSQIFSVGETKSDFWPGEVPDGGKKTISRLGNEYFEET